MQDYYYILLQLYHSRIGVITAASIFLAEAMVWNFFHDSLFLSYSVNFRGIIVTIFHAAFNANECMHEL